MKIRLKRLNAAECVNEREQTRRRLRGKKKETQFIFNFALTMCQEKHTKRWGKRRKTPWEIRRESRVTKLGIRFPFILVCMLLAGFCDLLRLPNDNYPRHGGCFVILLNATLHLALDPLFSSSPLLRPAEWRCRFQLVSFSVDTLLPLIRVCFFFATDCAPPIVLSSTPACGSW